QQANFLQELAQTTFSNVFNHLLWQVSSFFSRNSSNDFFSFGNIFVSDPALSLVTFHMFFAVYVCRVDTSLLQGNFNSLVYLFFLSLVNSYLYFSFFYRFRNTGFINCNRIHSSNLHSNSVSGSFSFFIHCNN